MTETTECVDQPKLLSKAGAILRALTPSRIVTLVLIRRGVSSQREIAKILDRTPPAVSNYIETLENLPITLVGKEGHDLWVTSQGKQVISALLRFTSNYLGIDLQSVGEHDITTEHLEQLEESLSPLHKFRSNPPFFVLYAIGNEGSVEGMIPPTASPVTIKTIVTAVNNWLNDSITRTQIRSRLRTLEDFGTVEIQEKSTTLTEKGIEQWRLLNQIMQISLSTTPVTSDSIAAAYQSGTGKALLLPQSVTVDELETIVSRFKQQSEDDLSLELVTQARTCSTD